ncbi:hypothetical protein QYE76_019090 [Lolium multiflorum]|uniref:Uncharacterized protein n=1 Tax=Lolium multiflorum TaxID=4521 RepID=A0AAD8R6B5_LOLMU|nr:hypothetical protein QYE76_019090 [Lolium multiflorum]
MSSALLPGSSSSLLPQPLAGASSSSSSSSSSSLSAQERKRFVGGYPMEEDDSSSSFLLVIIIVFAVRPSAESLCRQKLSGGRGVSLLLLFFFLYFFFFLLPIGGGGFHPEMEVVFAFACQFPFDEVLEVLFPVGQRQVAVWRMIGVSLRLAQGWGLEGRAGGGGTPCTSIGRVTRRLCGPSPEGPGPAAALSCSRLYCVARRCPPVGFDRNNPDYSPTWESFFINRRERTLARHEEGGPPPSNFNEAGRRLWWRGRTLQGVMAYRGPRLRYPQSQPTRALPPRFDYRDPDASDDDDGDYDDYSGEYYRARHEYD